MWKLVAAFFSREVAAGIMLGLDIVWSLHYFFTRNMFNPRKWKENLLAWVDVILSTGLTVASIHAPSLAVMLIFAAWTVRLYLRLLANKDNPNYWLCKTVAFIKTTTVKAFNFIYDSTCAFIGDVQAAASNTI